MCLAKDPCTKSVVVLKERQRLRHPTHAILLNSRGDNQKRPVLVRDTNTAGGRTEKEARRTHAGGFVAKTKVS